MEPWGWVAVRCVFRHQRRREQLYEERVTLWWAPDMDSAISRAEAEAQGYADGAGAEYLGLAQAYLLIDEPGDGAEIFSLIRSSSLDPDLYLDTFFDTGAERQREL